MSSGGRSETHLGGGVTPNGIDQAFLDHLAARASSGPVGDRIPVRSPFTGGVLATLPRATPGDVAAAAAAARDAQPAWARRAVPDRARILLRLHDRLLIRQEEVADLIQLETGKARWHAIEEVLYVAAATRHYAIHGVRYLRPRRARVVFPLLTSARVHRIPVGVVGIISPWNFPLVLGAGDMIPALLAGNAVLLRPDEQSSLTALWVADQAREAGLPEGLLQVLTGEGPVLGPALIDSVDYLMFTGSSQVGRIVGRQAVERLIGFSLELGGKNAMLVAADADLGRAVDGAIRGAFVGAGQVCVSHERILIHQSVYGAFVPRLLERVRSMNLSADLAYGVDMGSLTTMRQLETVREHIEDALAKGARLLAGGNPRTDLGPLFFEPTVLEAVTPDMRVYGEETFGPLVTLYSFATEDEAVELANDTGYGLNASIWSRNTRRTRALALRLRAGTVNINEAYGSTWAAIGAPMGGMKQSGIGRRQGEEGILKYTEALTATVQRGLAMAPAPPPISEPRWARMLNVILRISRYVPFWR